MNEMAEIPVYKAIKSAISEVRVLSQCSRGNDLEVNDKQKR